MANFDLSHLVQPPSQAVLGPIQDDEALLLFALIRVMRLRTVLEIGALGGYSAANFLKAVGADGAVFSCDVNPVATLAPNHRVIIKNARLLDKNDFDDVRLDLVFFDCHNYQVQMELFVSLRRAGVIVDRTILALHDTNLHPRQMLPWAYPVTGEDVGFVHQPAERRMVNDFKRMGYDAICFHTLMDAHDETLPFRHGVSILKKFVTLAT
jgi:SAM-dependent methyltransferase